MSAIACKIIICGQKAAAVSNISTLVVADLEQDLKLTDQVLKAQEKYIADMDKLLKPLTE